MFCFRKFIFIIPLTLLVNGCGYTIPDYIDAQRFKNTPQFITVAKQQHYQPISIRSISEIAINQNVIAHLCGTAQKIKICVIPQHQSVNQVQRYKPNKKIDIPLTQEHESYLLLDESNQLFVLSKDLSSDKDQGSNSEKTSKPRSIIGFESDLNYAKVKKLNIVDGQQIKNELIDSLLQEKKYRKKNDDEVGMDGILYEELNTVELTQPTSDSNESELTAIDIGKMIYEIFYQLLQNFLSLFQDLSNSLIYSAGYTLAKQAVSFAELPESFPQYYQEKLLAQITKSTCIQPFSTHQMDYLIQYEDHSQIFINTPMIDTLIESQKIKLCPHTNLQDVTQEKIIHEVVTGNRSSGNHYIGGYSAKGFNVYELNHIQFQAPFNQLSIYQQNQINIIEFPQSQFYLVPR